MYLRQQDNIAPIKNNITSTENYVMRANPRYILCVCTVCFQRTTVHRNLIEIVGFVFYVILFVYEYFICVGRIEIAKKNIVNLLFNKGNSAHADRNSFSFRLANIKKRGWRERERERESQTEVVCCRWLLIGGIIQVKMLVYCSIKGCTVHTGDVLHIRV